MQHLSIVYRMWKSFCKPEARRELVFAQQHSKNEAIGEEEHMDKDLRISTPFKSGSGQANWLWQLE